MSRACNIVASAVTWCALVQGCGGDEDIASTELYCAVAGNPCDLLSLRAEEMGTGIGGVVVYQNDVYIGGCLGCWFSSEELSVYALGAPAESAEEMGAVVESEAPIALVDAKRRYWLEVDSGAYLLCGAGFCTNVQVEEGRTATMNLEKTYWAPHLYTFSGGTAVADSTGLAPK